MKNKREGKNNKVSLLVQLCLIKVAILLPE